MCVTKNEHAQWQGNLNTTDCGRLAAILHRLQSACAGEEGPATQKGANIDSYSKDDRQCCACAAAAAPAAGLQRAPASAPPPSPAFI